MSRRRSTPKLTILGDHCTLLRHRSVLAQATHVFGEDPEVVFVPYDQLGDGGVGTVVVLNDREPFLRAKSDDYSLKIAY